MHDETADLTKSLLHSVVIINGSAEQGRQRIADAYRDARALIATMDTPTARPRILACFERFDAYKVAGDVAAAGWMLAALQERLAERDLRDWRKLMKIVDAAVRVLPPPGGTALH